jgi:hypothetical protein
MHRGQEAQHGVGGDVEPLRLRIVPGLRHHDHLRARGPRDPGHLGLTGRNPAAVAQRAAAGPVPRPVTSS